MDKRNTICLNVLLLLVSYSQSKRCGKELKKSRRISGGNIVFPNRYPWVVLFTFFKENSDDTYQCGGAIISEWHILTAKHCTRDVKNYGPLRISVHDIHDPKDYQKVEIKKAILPTQVESDDHDISILLLAKPLDFKDPKVGMVCLPKSENEDYTGKMAMGLGWGMEGVNEMGRYLKSVNLLVNDRQDKNYLYTKVSKVKGVHQDPCAGDSGGPLLYKEDDRWIVIGTVHGGGYDCLTGDNNGDGQWSKVTAHLKWIKHVIGNVSQIAKEEIHDVETNIKNKTEDGDQGKTEDIDTNEGYNADDEEDPQETNLKILQEHRNKLIEERRKKYKKIIKAESETNLEKGIKQHLKNRAELLSDYNLSLRDISGKRCGPKDSALRLSLQTKGYTDQEIEEMTTELRQKAFFRILDNNSDGILSYTEWVGQKISEDKNKYSWRVKLFNIQDENKDKQVSYQEFVNTQCAAYLFFKQHIKQRRNKPPDIRDLKQFKKTGNQNYQGGYYLVSTGKKLYLVERGA